MTMAVDDRDHTGRPLRSLEMCALHRRSIRLTCPVCGHVAVIDAVPLWWLFQRRGWDDRLPGAVRRRMYCVRCREKGGATRPALVVTRDKPIGDQPPYPSRQDWRRLVSRYRS